MRRILVPLDGSPLATKILPDAQRLAGRDGDIVLVHDVNFPTYDPEVNRYSTRKPTEEAQIYMEAQAATLRLQGTTVQVQTVVFNDISMSIDEAARIFKADMIACATHGRSPFGRLVRGGVAWRTLAHSVVPVMLRHFENKEPMETLSQLAQKHILIPLDGSPLAESAIPLATELAREWSAPIFMVCVIPELGTSSGLYGYTSNALDTEKQEAWQYLDNIAGKVSAEVHTRVVAGNVVASLAEAVEDLSITDIVITSHGRTGLSRVIVGSVADALVHRLTCPIIMIPALSVNHMQVTVNLETEPSAASEEVGVPV